MWKRNVLEQTTEHFYGAKPMNYANIVGSRNGFYVSTTLKNVILFSARKRLKRDSFSERFTARYAFVVFMSVGDTYHARRLHGRNVRKSETMDGWWTMISPVKTRPTRPFGSHDDRTSWTADFPARFGRETDGHATSGRTIVVLFIIQNASRPRFLLRVEFCKLSTVFLLSRRPVGKATRYTKS